MRNDWITFGIVMLLALSGVISIVSSEGGLSNGVPSLALKQMIFVGVGVLLYFLFSYIDYRLFKRIAGPLYILTLILLIIVLVAGAVRGGAERWLLIGSYQFQPSEHAKLLSVIVLARVFSGLPSQFGDRLTFFIGLVLMVPVWFLIAIEPDLGTTLIFFMFFLIMAFLSPISWKIPVTFVLIVMLLIPATWPLMKDYQKSRIMSFVNPAADPLGKGYQSNQSKIAIGSGGFAGKGLFRGTQNKLDFIPSQSTDFIFSIVGEEGGFVFSTIIVVTYMLLFFRIGSIAIRAPDKFGSLILWGICSFIFLQTFVNIGMTIGIMPVTGLPLPFMSYGINSLLLNFISLGVANSVYKHAWLPEKGF